MIRLACFALAVLAVLAPGVRAAEPYAVAATERLFPPDRPRHWRGAERPGLLTTIWYPADPGTAETPHPIGPPGQPLFIGHPIAQNAHVAAAPAGFPLVLLSHGTGGSAGSLDWLGSALAASGYVMVGLNHPGNTALGPLTGDGFRLWWERALDVGEALDGVLADPVLGPRIDRGRIGALGFSLGGYTVLELAGARTDREAFEAFCRSPAADAVCHPPELDRAVSTALTDSPETQASLARAGDSYRDKRIRAVFAIAPALGEALTPQSLTAIDIPVALLAGAADAIVPVSTNIERMKGFLPGAEMSLLPGAGHYTFLDLCEPAAAPQLGGLCQDGPGVDRAAIHTATVERVRAFFAKTLAP